MMTPSEVNENARKNLLAVAEFARGERINAALAKAVIDYAENLYNFITKKDSRVTAQP